MCLCVIRGPGQGTESLSTCGRPKVYSRGGLGVRGGRDPGGRGHMTLGAVPEDSLPVPLPASIGQGHITDSRPEVQSRWFNKGCWVRKEMLTWDTNGGDGGQGS